MSGEFFFPIWVLTIFGTADKIRGFDFLNIVSGIYKLNLDSSFYVRNPHGITQGGHESQFS
jgi:hypothetical protein